MNAFLSTRFERNGPMLLTLHVALATIKLAPCCYGVFCCVWPTTHLYIFILFEYRTWSWEWCKPNFKKCTKNRSIKLFVHERFWSRVFFYLAMFIWPNTLNSTLCFRLVRWFMAKTKIIFPGQKRVFIFAIKHQTKGASAIDLVGYQRVSLLNTVFWCLIAISKVKIAIEHQKIFFGLCQS